MAALMFAVPDDTARILKELDVPEGSPEQSSHITVAYLGEDVPIETIAELLPVLHSVTARTVPFSVSTSRITTFPAGDDGVPVIAAVESPELHAFQAALCSAMERGGIEYSRRFPVYKPHVTITYAEDPDTEFELSFPEISWPCHELLLWGSNKGNGRLVVKFPLSLPMGKVASPTQQMKAFSAYRKAMVQLAIWGDQGHRFVY
jgi:2'-5' RNA ligase